MTLDEQVVNRLYSVIPLVSVEEKKRTVSCR